MACPTRRTFLSACAAAGVYAPILAMGAAPVFAQSPGRMSIVSYKSSPEDADGVKEEAERLTRAAIEAIGGMSAYVSKGDVVWVKPNIGWDRRPELAGCTNPDVVATLVKLCFEAGAKEVHVSDNTCHNQKLTFAHSGIQQAAEREGARVYFLDSRKFKKMAIQGDIIKEWEVYTDVIEADKLINVPIAKHHGLSKVTLGMKNLMGIIGGARNQFHQQIDKTLADLAGFVKPDLVVIDAIRVLTKNGPVGGNPKDVERRDIVAAGTDQVALDAYGATLLGHKPEEIGHIREAASRGLGTLDYRTLSPKDMTI